jgi:hypothetical protein
MNATERKQIERDRRKSGLCRLDVWVPFLKSAEIMAAINAIVDRNDAE